MSTSLAGNALTTLARLKTELGLDAQDTSQDDHLALLVNASSAAIESELFRDLGRLEVTEVLSGYGRQRINLRRYPIESVSIAKVDGVAVTDFRILGEQGQLWRRQGWPLSANGYPDLTADLDPRTADLNVEVTYVGGFVLPKDETQQRPRALPWDIELECIQQCIDMHNRNPGMVSEQSASGTRYQVDPGLLHEGMRRLRRYRRWA